jgi:integrating conjugative element protein (TIGR03749 family)
MLISRYRIRGGVFCSLLVLLLNPLLVHADANVADTVERIAWQKQPIRLALRVGHERRVDFPAAVHVGLPAALAPLLRTQSVNGTVYLLAQAPFEATRLLVKERERGQVYLFDVVATEAGGQTHPIEVFVEDSPDGASPGAAASADDNASPLGYVALTRFAAQQLYAPARLLHDVPAIRRVPVSREPVNLVRGGAIHATPLVAWRAGGYYLTAVKLTNRTDQPQVLDPRALRGAWLTATFQHHRLRPAGEAADTTAVYLISARPFAVASR